ncbi:hypothetical protein CR513_32017, partial [Mucuna pruriens]
MVHSNPSFIALQSLSSQMVPSPSRFFGRHMKISDIVVPWIRDLDSLHYYYHDRNKKVKKDLVGNHENRCNYDKDPLESTLQDYFILAIEIIDNIYYSSVETSSFRLKLALINMMRNAG